MFNDLMQKIFHSSARAEAPPDAAAKPGVAPPSRVTVAAGQGAPAGGPVDVAATLDQMAASSKEKLDWKHSIVDLMKLVGMDSSQPARKALAADLHYTGDTNDSATMNMWLHKEVMTKLAANGGKVPPDLLRR
jgi:hypothetical protein